MKLILTGIGSGICLGVLFFFTLAQANASTCISTWGVSLTLESISVDGEVVDEYDVDNVPWPIQATTEVYAGDSAQNRFNSYGQVDEDMCFEYERDIK